LAFYSRCHIPPDGGIGHHCRNNCKQIGGAAVSPMLRRITRYMQSDKSRDSIFLILMSVQLDNPLIQEILVMIV